MKTLAIGDFHGKFPKKLFNLAKRKDIELIISQGDFCGNEERSKLFFKHVYGKDLELWQVIGKRKSNQLDRDNFKAGINILKKLNQLKKKTIAVRGNWDPINWQDIGFPRKRDGYTKKFNKEINKMKTIKIIDFKNYGFSGYNFVGYPRSTYPGRVTKHIEKKIKKGFKEKSDKLIKKIREDNKKYFKRLKNKFDNETIFISHNCPYNTKLDKLKKGPMKGEHYGSYLAKKLIKDLKPKLVICGHIHENQGKQQLGKTLIVNPGAARDGKAAIINLPDDKKDKIKVEFIR